jgi:hypothetical protein
MELSDREKVRIFNEAAKNSYLEVGYNNDLDEYYSSDASIRTTVGRIVREVSDHPSSYNISEDKAKMVKELIEGRKKSGRTDSVKNYSKKKVQQHMEKPLQEIVEGNRDMLSAVMHKKLRSLLKNNSELKDTSLSQISGAFSVMFDKSQIMLGKATENIAIQGNIDKDMEPEDAIDTVVKMRDKHVESNNN